MGRSVGRLEDAELLTGNTRAVADVHVEGLLHLTVLRSPVAHGRILGLDLAAVTEQPGVVAAYGGEDLRSLWRTPVKVNGPEGVAAPWQLPLAVAKVRYVGEPIAVVLATSSAAAADAIEFVDLDLAPLPAVVDVMDAESSASVLHEELGSNVAFRFEGRAEGDIDRVIADADVVIRRRFHHPRVMAAALEPRASMAIPADGGRVVLRTTTQVPHRIRDQVASILGIEASQLRVIAEHVGGGFGPKLDLYAEDVLCTALARKLGRPVRFVASRTEDLQATNHGRGQVQDITIAANRDGTLLAMDARVTADCGAYVSRAGSLIPLHGDRILPGAYRWQAFRFAAVGMFTNAVPTGAYRGAGRPEATYGVERAVDELAWELEMDPAALRRRNLPSSSEFPFASIGGMVYDSGDYLAALECAVDAAGYEELRAEQRRRRADGDALVLGIGLASYVDRCGTGPGVTEFGRVQIDARGDVEVSSGLGPTGQGTATSLAQVVADELGVQLSAIRVVHGDTERVASGSGTFGSRSMAVGGVAVSLAAQEVADEARRRAAQRLEADVADIELRDGRAVIRGGPTHGVDLGALATGEALGAERIFEPDGLVFPYGTHIAVVEIDTATGSLRVRRYLAVDDAGEVINPALFEGQLHGGIAQGIGQAVQESAVYDDAGNLLTGTFLDYTMPLGGDLPAFELHRTVSPAENPLGAKGVGEAGAIAAPAAVVNAAMDALRHLGVGELQMPLTPLSVWTAIEAAVDPPARAR